MHTWVFSVQESLEFQLFMPVPLDIPLLPRRFSLVIAWRMESGQVKTIAQVVISAEQGRLIHGFNKTLNSPGYPAGR